VLLVLVRAVPDPLPRIHPRLRGPPHLRGQDRPRDQTLSVPLHRQRTEHRRLLGQSPWHRPPD